MSATIGDGMTAIALAGGIVGYLYLKYQSREKRLEIIHQERMAAMEKGIPLPEFPPDPDATKRHASDQLVLPILGLVLFTLSLGTMVALFFAPLPGAHHFWVAPLPIAFLGVGLVSFHFSKANQQWR